MLCAGTVVDVTIVEAGTADVAAVADVAADTAGPTPASVAVGAIEPSAPGTIRSDDPGWFDHTTNDATATSPTDASANAGTAPTPQANLGTFRRGRDRVDPDHRRQVDGGQMRTKSRFDRIGHTDLRHV